MPKKFIWFLIVAQIVITLAHWMIFAVLITFFRDLAHFQGLLAFVLIILSLSFLTSTILDFKYDGPILRVVNIVSSIWLVYSLYFIMAGALSLFAYTLFGQHLRNFGWLTILISSGLTIYGIINARVARLTTIKVKLPNLPEAWRTKTAIMVSDLHLGHILHQGFANKVVNLINAHNPDIVFIPGDFYDGVKTNFAELAKTFTKVKAPLGIYFCSGNHEMFAGYEQCESALRGAGIKILENQSVDVQGLQVAGIAYHHDTIPGFKEILAGLKLDVTKPTILLKHVPLQLAEAAEAGVSLQLSGHTHHGQVWPFRYITARYFKGYDFGFKYFKKMAVYVSSGIGTWGPPMRVFTKSEMVKITFE